MRTVCRSSRFFGELADCCAYSMGEEPVDLDALQQQLRLKRASLADQILARLPEQREESRAGAEPLATSSRPATLGVGASTGKGQTGRGQLSAQDQKLRAKLGAKPVSYTHLRAHET